MKICFHFITAVLLSNVLLFAQADENQLKFAEEQKLSEASFRGAAIGHNMAFVSGSRGEVYKATLSELQLKWQLIELPKISKTDSLQFRDIAILDEQTILLMSAGEGYKSQIWKSNNRGSSFNKVYQNKFDKAFFNGIDFWNAKHGLLISDAIDEHVYLLETNDGGDNWTRLQSKELPMLNQKEYGFAASGTGLHCVNDSAVFVATGGSSARVFQSNNFGKNWKLYNTPMQHGASSKGIFSIDMFSKTIGIASGGDYAEDTLNGNNIIHFQLGKWEISSSANDIKFKSCIKYLTEEIILATGTIGTAVSYNGGQSWEYLGDIKPYHTIAFDTKSGRGIMTGGEGRVISFELK